MSSVMSVYLVWSMSFKARYYWSTFISENKERKGNNYDSGLPVYLFFLCGCCKTLSYVFKWPVTIIDFILFLCISCESLYLIYISCLSTGKLSHHIYTYIIWKFIYLASINNLRGIDWQGSFVCTCIEKQIWFTQFFFFVCIEKV